MGVWDRVGGLFASGVRLQVALDDDRVPAGGFVSAQVELIAGRKPVAVAGLHLSLVKTAVRPPGSSTTSEIQQRPVAHATVGSGLRLSPRERRTVSASFQVPRDAEASDDDTSYRVRVEAELAEGRSPHAYAAIRIVDAASGRPSLPAIEQRFPGLSSTEEADRVDALQKLRWAHDPEDPTRDLLAVAPRLAALVERGQGEDRRAALQAWSSVVGARVGDSHVALLRRMVDTEAEDVALLTEVATAAGRGGSARTLPVLAALAEHAEADVRRAAAQSLGAVAKSTTKRDALLALARDDDPRTRAAAVRGLGDFVDEGTVVEVLARACDDEVSPGVLAALVGALERAFGEGHGDVVRPVFTRLAQSDDADVRVALARSLYFAELDEASLPIALGLLADSDPEVRFIAAAEARNLPHRGAAMVGTLEAMADGDPSPRARRGALTSLPELVAPEAMRARLEALVDGDAEVEVLLGIVDGLAYRREAQYRDVLDRLARHPDKEVASAAAKALEARGPGSGPQ